MRWSAAPPACRVVKLPVARNPGITFLSRSSLARYVLHWDEMLTKFDYPVKARLRAEAC
jgi:hypothetical protein